MSAIPVAHASAIGTKLRSARKKRQLSLRELAGRAEISASMLSQIETGKAYPSVRSIYSIAAALDVPVDYFFPEQGSGKAAALDLPPPPAGELTASEMREATVNREAESEGVDFPSNELAPTPVVHASARPTIELKGGVTWARLTALAELGAEYLEITYAPGATSGANLSHHEGREFGIVLSGELTVELGFEAYTLGPGDSIIFDSETPHRLNNKAGQTARALWVVLSRA